MELDFYQPIVVPLALKILVIVGKQDYTLHICSFISWYTGDRGESWYKVVALTFCSQQQI
jgi:hypothetical protein